MRGEREQPIIIVRKKVHAARHHGGAWKVAFADFMTAMMALFLVLWIVTQSTDIKSAIAGYFTDPLGRASEFGNSFIPGTGAQAANVRPISETQILEMRRDRLQQMGARIRQQLKKHPEFKNVEQYVAIQLVSEGLRIELLESDRGVFFDLGKATPSPEGRQILALLATEFATLANPIMIEGHTDSRPYRWSSSYSNWELSTDRANAARRIMQVAGLPESQVLQVRGHADRTLRDPTDPFSPSNRRVTMTVLTEYNLPMPEESAEAAEPPTQAGSASSHEP